ncbi:WD40 repeat-like protein [Punctularia strigosozonata HHB-11173 SS5]|uniref:WD40 repeat-like protein n=1 Tax=Punctularia strigosozonata (strain HHB-11173) TaxID=741275 RepID=R7S4G6_PUNST|nr:WD40 repeat-like protein [Punctularia strigosozonata HHB-11173 SS5]EIN04141.1 WD40 repeat-like protein [Punctularia strigosozonata HHB-11173 SS5]
MLYTAGRDGMVIAWDLGVPMRPRAPAPPDFKPRWEAMTGWADEGAEEDEAELDETLGTSGDVLGEVTAGLRTRRRRFSSARGEEPMPVEERWEADVAMYETMEPLEKVAQFRQSAQMHADWVNDVALCNMNQTVLTASSDGTVKAWNPHSLASPEPSTIGTHTDYVRCLAPCRAQSWVASGSFDRTIKLWDLTRPASSFSQSSSRPLTTLNPPDAAGAKASVYAIAADPYGHTIASGSPERVVRIWDPRSGKRVAKLVGHTDNIRSILISEDARYLLTGSSDASIKLWSLTSQRCLHTFTHHTESVWSLHSSHPTLEVFYSGDRSGLVCKVDVERCAEVADGEGVLLCQDRGEQGGFEGVHDLVAMDDHLLWTATGASSVKKWRVPPRRSARDVVDSPGGMMTLESPRGWGAHHRTSISTDHSPAPSDPFRSASPSLNLRAQHRMSVADSILSHRDTEHEHDEPTLHGIPLESLVKLSSPNDPFALGASIARGRDPEVATLYSAASIMSVPKQQRAARSPLGAIFTNHPTTGNNNNGNNNGMPLGSPRHVDTSARAEYEEREVAADAVPLRDAPEEVLAGERGLVRAAVLNDRMHALTVDTAGEVAVWDLVRCACVGRIAREDVAAASPAGSEGGSGDRERSPREALETVRERIEGEAVVVPWSTLDTKTGVLSVHMTERCFEAEIYADESGYGPERHFNDELRLSIGKWILRNLFLGFIREEQRIHRRLRDEQHAFNDAASGRRSLHRGHAPAHIDFSHLSRRGGSETPEPATPTTPVTPARHSPVASSTVFTAARMLPAVAPASPPSAGVRSSPLIAPMISLAKDTGATVLSPIPQSPSSAVDANATPSAAASPPRDADYFAPRARTSAGNATPDEAGAAGQTPSTPSAGKLMGRIRGFRWPNSSRPPSESGPPGMLLPSEAPNNSEQHASAEVAQTPVQALMAGALSPPSSADGPPLSLPPSTIVMISEEAPPGWRTTYRGTVSSVGLDVPALEAAAPMWLAEYLLLNKVPPIPVLKVGFVLLPYQSREPAERLPELLNAAQSKLTASRFLRVRKLTYHVQDKLDKLTGGSAAVSRANTPRSSFDASKRSPSSTSLAGLTVSRQQAEENFEILCNDIVLPLDMTLAAVRQFVWKSSAELVMHYRRRVPPLPAGAMFTPGSSPR